MGLAAALAVVIWAAVSGRVAFSPGALSGRTSGRTLGGVASHAAIADCEGCHTAFWSGSTMAERCLGCHTSVRTEIASRRGLHGRLTGATSSPTCRGCHAEHHGPAAALTVGGNDFPHDLTGYSLRGHRRTAAGAAVRCSECHRSGLASFDQGTCRTCHEGRDAAFMARHAAAFGGECLACHDGSGAFGVDFDHGKLPFKLTGKHAALACASCHRDTSSVRALRATPRECYGCHKKDDRHGGSFGRDCAFCHSTTGWGDAHFDHSIFPLDHGSQERRPACRTCHPVDVSRYTCYGCHAHTPQSVAGQHEGQDPAALADCIRCHAGGAREGGGD